MSDNLLQIFKNLLNTIKQMMSDKCEYADTCTHYRDNYNCNHEPHNCGIFKRIRRGITKKEGNNGL